MRLSRSRLSKAARDANQAYFLADASSNGFTPSVEVTIRFEGASPPYAAVLDVPPGTELLVRERVMSADGRPVQLATSRLPRELTRGTRAEDLDTGPGGIYSRLEETGHRASRHSELVKTKMPTREEATALQLGSGIPVLVLQRVAYESSGRPIEVNEMILAGDRYELSYEIPAD